MISTPSRPYPFSVLISFAFIFFYLSEIYEFSFKFFIPLLKTEGTAGTVPFSLFNLLNLQI
jgi:hypothetical protein